MGSMPKPSIRNKLITGKINEKAIAASPFNQKYTPEFPLKSSNFIQSYLYAQKASTKPESTQFSWKTGMIHFYTDKKGELKALLPENWATTLN
jgi:hypothetical protein